MNMQHTKMVEFARRKLRNKSALIANLNMDQSSLFECANITHISLIRLLALVAMDHHQFDPEVWTIIEGDFRPIEEVIQIVEHSYSTITDFCVRLTNAFSHVMITPEFESKVKLENFDYDADKSLFANMKLTRMQQTLSELPATIATITTMCNIDLAKYSIVFYTQYLDLMRCLLMKIKLQIAQS